MDNSSMDDIFQNLAELQITSHRATSGRQDAFRLPIIADVIHLNDKVAVLQVCENGETKFLKICNSSLNVSEQKASLYIGAEVQVESVKLAHRNADSVASPKWIVSKYRCSNTTASSVPVDRQIVVIESVHRNYVMVLGSNFSTPTPVYLENSNSISPQSFIVGNVYSLPPFFETRVINGQIYHMKNVLEQKNYEQAVQNHYRDSVNNAVPPTPKNKFFMDHAEPLSVQQKRFILSGCKDVQSLDLTKARLYIRDPLVAIKRLELHLENLSAIEHTVELEVPIFLKCDRRGSHAKYSMTISLDRLEVRRCLKSSSSDSWHLGTELVVKHRSLKGQILAVVVDSMVLSADDGCDINLVVSKQSTELAELLFRTKTKLDKPSIGPQLNDLQIMESQSCISAIMMGFDDFFKRLGFLYCGRTPVEQLDPLTNWPSFTVNGFPLDQSQLHAMRTAASRRGWVCVSAPPGSGKTFMISALVRARQEEDDETRPPSLVMSSTTNAAVNNAVEAIARSCPDIRTCREYSIKAESELSELSGSRSLKKMAEKAQEHLDILKFPDLRKAIGRHRCAKNDLKSCGGDLQSGLHCLSSVRIAEKDVRSSFLKAYEPFIFGATSSLILRRNLHATHLILDEASQLSIADALGLYCCMPKLTHITLVGDSQQLRPFNRLEASSFAARIMQNGELQRMENSISSYKCMLQTIYRCHPRIVDLFLKPIYGPKLHAGTKESDRDIAQQKGLPVAKDKSPCLLVHIENGKGEGGFNQLELDTAVNFVLKLQEKGITGEDVAVVCHHRKQKDGLVKRLKGKGTVGSMNLLVSVFTIDSFQGKEAKVVLILTTKTSDSACEKRVLSALSFVSDFNRETVAVSRAQHALYIFGEWTNLIQTPFWSQFGASIHDAGAIVDRDWSLIPDPSWLLMKSQPTIKEIVPNKHWSRKQNKKEALLIDIEKPRIVQNEVAAKSRSKTAPKSKQQAVVVKKGGRKPKGRKNQDPQLQFWEE